LENIGGRGRGGVGGSEDGDEDCLCGRKLFSWSYLSLFWF
jgi:hypothetical protein